VQTENMSLTVESLDKIYSTNIINLIKFNEAGIFPASLYFSRIKSVFRPV
jgi:hypothetical protein